MRSTATFSDCGRYRYRLLRVWRDDLPKLVFIMLNPSLADENRSDPTVTRCVTRALNGEYGGVEVYNLFALISPYPKDLLKVEDPIGSQNDDYLRSIIHNDIIVGWGAEVLKLGRFCRRDEDVLKLLNRPVKALKVSAKTGKPYHPLYVSYSAVPMEYRLR
jgi:hypothetical protein